MKQSVAVFIISILCLLPTTAFAQRRGGPQTRVGSFVVNVTYDGLTEFQSSKPSGADKTKDEHYSTKFHVEYQVLQTVKVIRHDSTTSIVEPQEAKARGSFSYEHSGEEHSVSSDDLHYDAKEQANYKGLFSTAGSIGHDTPDTGDQLSSVDVSVNGTGGGSFKKVSTLESWVFEGGRNVKKKGEPQSDTTCQMGQNTGPNSIDLSGSSPDTTKPPESACSATLQIGVNVPVRNDAAPTEIEHAGQWIEATETGSFAVGKYTISLTATHKPTEYQRDVDGDKTTFTEKISFVLTLTLAGAVAAIGSPDNRPDSNTLTNALLPTDRLRFLARFGFRRM